MRLHRQRNAGGPERTPERVDRAAAVCYTPSFPAIAFRFAALAVGDGCVAQLVEQLTLNQRVQGSNPCTPTNEINDLALPQCFRVDA
jgi:hypothetical protein